MSITVWLQATVKSVQPTHRMLLILGMLGIAGCGSSLVGLQTDGTYVLETGERSASCDSLKRSFQSRVDLLKSLPAKAKAEREEVPQTALSMMGRWMSASNAGLAAVTLYDRERAHAQAVQRTMHDKKCLAVDLDQELSQADAEMKTIRGM